MKNRIIFQLSGITLLALLTAPLLTGCETLAQQRARESMRQREDMLMAQENSQRLAGRLESMEFEIENLQRELARVREEAGRAAEIEIDALDNRLDTTERKITALERNREKDKQEIVDTLSKKIVAVMQKSGGSSSGSRRSGRRSEYGYEHTVLAGQTLSEIGSAYGVSVKVIMEENDIRNPNLLRAGQVLFIPE